MKGQKTAKQPAEFLHKKQGNNPWKTPPAATENQPARDPKSQNKRQGSISQEKAASKGKPRGRATGTTTANRNQKDKGRGGSNQG
ncbi:hypothetical protein MA16_Dca010957 [Dendrobium catenatum]|uniref:Uncharacterized protein n=1 Tax=Dendrobium catenatum TaxID=906689 RepID=A0A2I0WVP0_9ASPA|nr:hypothetical protein MA16_Dca010957 [Dendrobium catenatum]